MEGGDPRITHESHERLSALRDVISVKVFSNLTENKELYELSEAEAKRLIARLDLIYEHVMNIATKLEFYIEKNQQVALIDGTALAKILIPILGDELLSIPQA